MALTNAGRNLIATALQGGVFTPFDSGNAYLGVGDGNTAFGAAQTDLQGTNKKRNAMQATYPLLATNVITYRALYSTSEANFAWEEWGVFNAAAAGTMLNRKVESLGTKANTQSWQFTVDITVNNP